MALLDILDSGELSPVILLTRGNVGNVSDISSKNENSSLLQRGNTGTVTDELSNGEFVILTESEITIYTLDISPVSINVDTSDITYVVSRVFDISPSSINVTPTTVTFDTTRTFDIAPASIDVDSLDLTLIVSRLLILHLHRLLLTLQTLL